MTRFRRQLRNVLTVYKKETRETLRDRRTLAIMFLLPLVLYPLTTIVLSEVVISSQLARKAESSRVRVVGPKEPATALAESLRAIDPLLATEVRDEPLPSWTPSSGAGVLERAQVVVALPPDLPSTLTAGGSAPVRIFYDAADDGSRQARTRVEEALAKHTEALVAERLRTRGLERSLVEPLRPEPVDLATPATVGRTQLSRLLPLLIVIMTIFGAFYPAIDQTAGEKERGTLEPLLATPMPRQAILAGKYLTVATMSALTAVFNVACMGATALWIARNAAAAAGKDAGKGQIGALLGNLPWGGVTIALLGLICATLLFSGVLMTIAALGRNFKEAQALLTPVYTALMMPAMVAVLPGAHLDYTYALVPIANVTLLLAGAIAGTLAPGPAFVTLAMTALLAAVAMAITARIYDSERLLFAPDTPRDRRTLRARLVAAFRGQGVPAAPASELPPGEALALFAVVAVVFFTVGPSLQARGLGGLAASEWLLIALPTVLFARARGGVVPTLGLAAPSPRALVGAALVGSSAWFLLAVLVLPVQERLLPMPPGLKEQLEPLVKNDAPVILILLAVSVTPAICEELLCRGALLRAFRSTLGARGAVLFAAALFALLHLSIYRLVPTFLLGVLAGVAATAARSLWPAVLLHALNNGAVVLLATAPGARIVAFLEAHELPALGVALALFAAGLGLLLRGDRPEKRSDDHTLERAP